MFGDVDGFAIDQLGFHRFCEAASCGETPYQRASLEPARAAHVSDHRCEDISVAPGCGCATINAGEDVLAVGDPATGSLMLGDEAGFCWLLHLPFSFDLLALETKFRG